MTLTKQIQNLTVTDTVRLDKAIPVLSKFDLERAETMALLKRCIPQVGMMLGEELNAAVAKIEGTHFSVTDYHAERMVDSQRV